MFKKPGFIKTVFANTGQTGMLISCRLSAETPEAAHNECFVVSGCIRTAASGKPLMFKCHPIFQVKVIQVPCLCDVIDKSPRVNVFLVITRTHLAGLSDRFLPEDITFISRKTLATSQFLFKVNLRKEANVWPL